MKFENAPIYAIIRKHDDCIEILENPQDIEGIFYIGFTSRGVMVYCSSMDQLKDSKSWFEKEGMQIV